MAGMLIHIECYFKIIGDVHLTLLIGTIFWNKTIPYACMRMDLEKKIDLGTPIWFFKKIDSVKNDGSFKIYCSYYYDCQMSRDHDHDHV